MIRRMGNEHQTGGKPQLLEEEVASAAKLMREEIGIATVRMLVQHFGKAESTFKKMFMKNRDFRKDNQVLNNSEFRRYQNVVFMVLLMQLGLLNKRNLARLKGVSIHTIENQIEQDSEFREAYNAMRTEMRRFLYSREYLQSRADRTWEILKEPPRKHPN